MASHPVHRKIIRAPARVSFVCETCGKAVYCTTAPTEKPAAWAHVKE